MLINHSLYWWFSWEGSLLTVSFLPGWILWGSIFLSNFQYRWGKAYYSLFHFKAYFFVISCSKQCLCCSNFQSRCHKSLIFWSNVQVKKLISSSLFQITRIWSLIRRCVFRETSLYHWTLFALFVCSPIFWFPRSISSPLIYSFSHRSSH